LSALAFYAIVSGKSRLMLRRKKEVCTLNGETIRLNSVRYDWLEL